MLRWGQGDSFPGLALPEQTELPRTVKSEQVSTRTEMPAEVTEGYWRIVGRVLPERTCVVESADLLQTPGFWFPLDTLLE